LIDSIEIEKEDWNRNGWKPYLFVNLLYVCFCACSPTVSKSDRRQVQNTTISTLVVDKMQFILSDRIWLNDGCDTQKKIEILRYFIELLDVYRIDVIYHQQLLDRRVNKLMQLEPHNAWLKAIASKLHKRMQCVELITFSK
jgi:hypothetical protein